MFESVVDFTVAICTFNGSSRLPQVLDRLRSQEDTEDFRWQIVVVDNNSIDDTAQVVQRYQQQWPAKFPLYYLFEPRQGIAYARRRVVQDVETPWIGFLDDDNWPAQNWVAEAYRFRQSHSHVGAYGSQLHPYYEGLPPRGMNYIACFLGIFEHPNSFRYPPHKWRFPAGAGLVIRRQAWLQYVPEQPRLRGVCRRTLTAKGEDVETLSYLNRAGWEIWHNPDMHLTHYIPRYRLKAEYLMKVFQGVGLSRHPTRMIRYAFWLWPLATLAYFGNDLRKLFIHLGQRPRPGRQLAFDCQRQLLFYSLVSPFYHAWQAIRSPRLLSPRPPSIRGLALPPTGDT